MEELCLISSAENSTELQYIEDLALCLHPQALLKLKHLDLQSSLGGRSQH